MRMKKIFSLFVTCLLVMSAAAVPVARRTAKTDKAVVRFDAQAARQNRHAVNNVAAKFDRSAKAQVAAAPARPEISDGAILLSQAPSQYISNINSFQNKKFILFANPLVIIIR